MNPFAFLGVPQDADQATVKRAYALRLRDARPDRDPDGFQQLHAAYKAAMAWCHSHAQQHDEPTLVQQDAAQEPVLVESAAATPVPRPISLQAAAPLAQPETPRITTPLVEAFDCADFFQRATAFARDNSGAELLQWLQAEPGFWSLDNKSRVRHALLETLHRQYAPMRAECFDALQSFFDLDHVLAGLDALAVQRLRRQLHLAWEMLPENFVHLAARMRQAPATCSGDSELRQWLKELTQPFRWQRVLARIAQIDHPKRITSFVQRLSFGRIEELPEQFDRRGIAFWRNAANGAAVSMPRVVVGLLRIVVATALGFMFASVQSKTENRDGLWVFAALLPITGGAWLAMITWQALMLWLTIRSNRDEPRWRFVLRLGFIPGLALCGVLLHLLIDTRVGIGPLLLALALGFATLLRPRGRPVELIGCFGALLMITGGFFAISEDYFCELIALTAVAFWMIHLWKQRAQLRTA